MLKLLLLLLEGFSVRRLQCVGLPKLRDLKKGVAIAEAKGGPIISVVPFVSCSCYLE